MVATIRRTANDIAIQQLPLPMTVVEALDDTKDDAGASSHERVGFDVNTHQRGERHR